MLEDTGIYAEFGSRESLAKAMVDLLSDEEGFVTALGSLSGRGQSFHGERLERKVQGRLQ